MEGKMMLHKEITDKIINAYYKVYNTLGYGFLEKVYENALAIELRKSGLKVEQQKNIKVYYETEEVGDYYADLFMENETHQIWEWYGMYGYFAPVETAIDALWEDLLPAFDYWLDLTPRLQITPKKITGSPTEGSVVSVTLSLKNLSPCIETIDRIFIVDMDLNEYLSDGSTLSFSEIDPLESKTISFDITVNSSIITEKNLTFLVGNDYIGYIPVTIIKNQINKNTSIEIHSMLLAIPLLIYFKKKQ